MNILICYELGFKSGGAPLGVGHAFVWVESFTEFAIEEAVAKIQADCVAKYKKTNSGSPTVDNTYVVIRSVAKLD
jgi:hypothetical protein